MTSENWNERRNSILMMCHYPDLGSASDWLNQISHAARPIRSTTQIWVVTRHQCEFLHSFLRRHFARKSVVAEAILKRTLDYFPVMLRGLRTNEKKVNENRHCRNKTNANKLIIAQRFTSISLSHVMIKWRYRHCLHHFYYISISILRRFLWQVNKIKINKYSNLRGIPPNKSRLAIWNQSETPTRSG